MSAAFRSEAKIFYELEKQSDDQKTAGGRFAPIIGASLPRIDGPLKTTGAATYTADLHLPEMVYAVPVCSTIAHGSINSLDASAAEKLPGVLLVLHHRNIGPLFRIVPDGADTRISEA